MCGMAGFICDNTFDMDIKALRNLLMLNTFRGEDSTGMFDCVPEQKPQVMLWKTSTHPLDFLNNQFYRTWGDRWKKHKPLFAAIHCRAATQGKITKMNAHPFKHGHIIGMHNGTVDRKFTNRDKFDTDSEAIFYNISTMGLNKAIEELQDASPAYALVWYNLKEKSLNFIRNNKRPLSYTKSLSGSIFWSSDSDHLSVGVPPVMVSRTRISTQSFEVGVHYKLNVTDKKMDFEKTEIKEAAEKVSTYRENVFSYNAYSSDYWNSSRCDADNQPGKAVPLWKKEKLNDKLPFHMTTKEEAKAEPVYPFGRGLSSFCNEHTFREKTRQGCCLCGMKVSPEDKTIWIDEKDFVCYDCADSMISDKAHWVHEAEYLTKEQKESIYTDFTKITVTRKE